MRKDNGQRLKDRSYRKVKIAVLDTGLQPGAYMERPEQYRDFVDPSSNSRIDNTSHGTSSVNLIRKIYEDADLYVGRVFESDHTDELKEPAQMAQVGRNLKWSPRLDANVTRLSNGP